jgi:nucleoid DNA-binding protein
MNKVISKNKLAALISKRLGKTLPKSAIVDAIAIINNSLIDMIVDNKSISIGNFGTISPYLFHKHKGFNISTGEMQEVDEFKTVKFRVHNNFQMLVNGRKSKFKKA